MRIAVVTGASSGIGRVFVKRLDEAEQWDEIWVIARHEEALLRLQSEVRARVRVLALDLTKEEALAKYAATLREGNVTVGALVNASGYGKFEAFSELPLIEQMGMVDLNAKALMAVTYHTLSYMESGAQIYQVGSLSAFQPVPYIGVYGATKAFVLSFSRALNAELRTRKIRVMAVCPGWVKTAFFDRSVTDDDVIVYYNKFFTPEQVVARALRDMRRGKDVSVCGWSIRAQVLLTKLLPHRLVMWIWLKQQKKL